MVRRIFFLSLLLILISILSAQNHSQSEANFDIIIKNGRIIDGSGNPWYYADVGIKGETISAI